MKIIDSSSDDPVKKYLVVKGSGGAGLGDKLRAIISAVIYARLTDRIIYIDWNDPAYGDGVKNYFSSLFGLEGVRTTSKCPLFTNVRPAIWQKKLHLNFDQLYVEMGTPEWNRSWASKTFSFDQGVLDWPEEVCVMWDFDQFHALKQHLPELYSSIQGNESDEWQQGEVLRRHVIPSSAVKKQCEPYMSQLDATRPVVGVHVRATDESFRVRSAPAVIEYLKAVKKITRQGEAKMIFLATDNRAVQDLFCKKFGADQVLWTEKWLPDPGVALHLANECPDRLQSARDALVDIFLLASADYLVTLANSSFSIIARMFSEVPSEKRITLLGHTPLWRRALGKIKLR